MSKVHITLALFGKIVQITLKESRFTARQNDFRAYIMDYYNPYVVKNTQTPTFTITIEDGGEHILLIRQKQDYFARFVTVQNQHYTSYYHADETVINIIVRMIISTILKGNGIVLHASSIIYNNSAVLFCGKSGVGKSTIAMQLGKKYNHFSDDLLCITYRDSEKAYFAQQIPIPEKNYIKKTLASYPISKIFFLKRSKLSHITKIAHSDKSYQLLLKQLWTEEDHMHRDIKTLMAFHTTHPEYYHFALGNINSNSSYFNKHIRRL